MVRQRRPGIRERGHRRRAHPHGFLGQAGHRPPQPRGRLSHRAQPDAAVSPARKPNAVLCGWWRRTSSRARRRRSACSGPPRRRRSPRQPRVRLARRVGLGGDAVRVEQAGGKAAGGSTSDQPGTVEERPRLRTARRCGRAGRIRTRRGCESQQPPAAADGASQQPRVLGQGPPRGTGRRRPRSPLRKTSVPPCTSPTNMRRCRSSDVVHDAARQPPARTRSRGR